MGTTTMALGPVYIEQNWRQSGKRCFALTYSAEMDDFNDAYIPQALLDASQGQSITFTHISATSEDMDVGGGIILHAISFTFGTGKSNVHLASPGQTGAAGNFDTTDVWENINVSCESSYITTASMVRFAYRGFAVATDTLEVSIRGYIEGTQIQGEPTQVNLQSTSRPLRDMWRK